MGNNAKQEICHLSFLIFLARIVKKMLFWGFSSVTTYRNGSTSQEGEEVKGKIQARQLVPMCGSFLYGANSMFLNKERWEGGDPVGMGRKGVGTGR